MTITLSTSSFLTDDAVGLWSHRGALDRSVCQVGQFGLTLLHVPIIHGEVRYVTVKLALNGKLSIRRRRRQASSGSADMSFKRCHKQGWHVAT